MLNLQLEIVGIFVCLQKDIQVQNVLFTLSNILKQKLRNLHISQRGCFMSALFVFKTRSDRNFVYSPHFWARVEVEEI